MRKKHPPFIVGSLKVVEKVGRMEVTMLVLEIGDDGISIIPGWETRGGGWAIDDVEAGVLSQLQSPLRPDPASAASSKIRGPLKKIIIS